jgi:MFS family permease
VNGWARVSSPTTVRGGRHLSFDQCSLSTGSVILSTVAKPSLVSLLSGVLNIFFALGCVPLYFTVERVGRRSVLLYGAIAMTILITVFTALVAVGPGHPDIQWASIAIIFLFLATFGYAWQGCVWLYCSEIGISVLLRLHDNR